MNFTNSLAKWYLENKRNLPWRNTKDPYFIWLSEIILQQTRVAQGLPYFLAFVDAFPTVFELANASEEQVLKLWQGLGYYSRARNLHRTARFIVDDLNGVFPGNFGDLLQLKGVGPYTAAAIASFAYNEAVPVVDGNVFRVLARYFDIETDIGSPLAKKEFYALAMELLDKKDPWLFNQAIMEFGALQCVPQNPACNSCVLSQSCLALQKNKVGQLPVKSKKVQVRKRYLNYIIFLDIAKHTIIQKRSVKGIWHNLYEFPLIETTHEVGLEEMLQLIRIQKFIDNNLVSIEEIEVKAQVHKLTHQQLYIKFWRINVEGMLLNGLTPVQLKSHPFPIVIFNFIEKEWK